MDVRADFPVLSRRVNGKRIVYLDSACMSLRPNCVIDAVAGYYRKYDSCAGRSVHQLAVEAAREVEGARGSLAKFIDAKPENIIFTKNTTESINLLSHSLELRKGDAVLTTDMEHNSNLIPWQQLKARGIRHKTCFTDDGVFDARLFEKALTKDVKVVSFIHSSNILGTTLPAKEIAKIAHDHGATVIIDAAQSVPHQPVDFKGIGADFLCFSAHKMCGPTGVGVLCGKTELLESLAPFITGGDTVTDSTYDSCVFSPPPQKFEAGLQNYAGMIGAGEAARYLSKIGMEKVQKHERGLCKELAEKLSSTEHVRLISSKDSNSLATFTIDKADPHDVAIILSETENIFVRSGMHCAHSWFNAHKIKGSVRASLHVYNGKDDIDILAETVGKIAADFN